jgi:hypothetical protein
MCIKSGSSARAVKATANRQTTGRKNDSNFRSRSELLWHGALWEGTGQENKEACRWKGSASREGTQRWWPWLPKDIQEGQRTANQGLVQKAVVPRPFGYTLRSKKYYFLKRGVKRNVRNHFIIICPLAAQMAHSVFQSTSANSSSTWQK